ncbi:MAG: hypothetical protein M1272_05510 [Firmicutes bacterium]|nr:hypothetical protein [Bacillota bacterium]
MTYRFAKNLHNEDEVRVKRTGEVVRVINTETHNKDVYVFCVTQTDGYTKLRHTEIE